MSLADVGAARPGRPRTPDGRLVADGTSQQGDDDVIPIVAFLENHFGGDVAAPAPPLSSGLLVPMTGIGGRSKQTGTGAWLQRLSRELAEPCPAGAVDCAHELGVWQGLVPGQTVVVEPQTLPTVTAPWVGRSPRRASGSWRPPSRPGSGRPPEASRRCAPSPGPGRRAGRLPVMAPGPHGAPKIARPATGVVGGACWSSGQNPPRSARSPGRYRSLRRSASTRSSLACPR